MTGHVTAPAAALADQLPGWVTLLRAPNPGPMTLDGTNTWVLRAPRAAEAVVVDPGPLDEGHLDAIMAHAPISLILLTHGHPDHVEAVDELARRAGAPVWGLADGYQRPDDPLTDGALFRAAGLTITAVPTPGHTADSVCFLVEGGSDRAVFTGDTILGRGTTVVAHPDGDLGDYLASLETLAAYEDLPALPGHGPALADCAAAARFYLAHRRARLDQVRQAVAQGARTPSEVVAAVYADVDRSLWPAAEWSVRAQLAHLDRETRESDPGVVGLDTP
ncbi:Glyoxylase, beta-lactamase superfamily II [Micromonospora pattaloongensis]|uniref:Glyoxylase, beta-lactamase superfamily II n=1 Tax=Micromonospora pattaloongensis TaxID=405436 RepID=A0A1H3HC47_9ACTN|nr:MBL fold metallo-hydrolase [Micromonospora pattaloongensis]SDY13153.1 Glyoxylase, beta-lactamase superfamily II [Micromonospora pattaloongensis]